MTGDLAFGWGRECSGWVQSSIRGLDDDGGGVGHVGGHVPLGLVVLSGVLGERGLREVEEACEWEGEAEW